MPKKELTVGLPALLNLKAELERAQSESRQGGSSAKKRKAVPSDDVGSTNRGVLARAQKDALALKDANPSRKQASALAKQALEEKAHIYDMLNGSGSAPAVQLGESRLAKILEESSVDFVRRRQQLQAASKAFNHDTTEEGAVSDGSMVEIIDEFGRSRTVPRNKVRDYCQYSTSSSSSDSDSSVDSRSETAARQNRSAGYYRLSSNYAEREEQLSKLRLLHSETIETRQTAAVSIAEMQTQQYEQRRTEIRALYINKHT
ncbi:hypothetical protein GGH96_004056 [Coemansia sp. RSA 1972]|nr:hypothetical protein GGH96_004056 [Coemansia sp. RSA 1972]